MKQRILRIASLMLAMVLIFGMLPATANAANITLGTPASVKINKYWNYDTNKLATGYGWVSWKPVEPVAAGDIAWYIMDIYRDGKLVGGHEAGWDPEYARSVSYLSYDLAPMLDSWESGTYYFTVRTSNRTFESTHNTSAAGKSAEWEYTKPSKKMATPTNAKWASSSGYAMPEASWTANADASHKIYYYYRPTKVEDPTNGGKDGYSTSQWRVWDDSVQPYMDYGPGYYWFSVRAISPDLSKYANSDVSAISGVFHYKLGTPKPAVEIKASTGKPVISWKAIEWADYYQIYRATAADGDYDKVGTVTGTTFTDTSAAPGTTYYYRLRAGRENGMKSSYAKAISITTPGEPTELKITQQPKSVTIAEGATAKVTLKAQGDGLIYKWYYKDKGASKYTYTSTFKTNTYSVKMTDARDGRRVLCKIYDQYGNMVQSNSVTINMAQPVELAITQQPRSVTVAKGETAKVTVKAVGEGLTYKWYYKNAGDTKYTYTDSFKTNTYSVKMTDARDGRRVLCKVYDKYGNMVQSNSVTINMK